MFSTLTQKFLLSKTFRFMLFPLFFNFSQKENSKEFKIKLNLYCKFRLSSLYAERLVLGSSSLFLQPRLKKFLSFFFHFLDVFK